MKTIAKQIMLMFFLSLTYFPALSERIQIYPERDRVGKENIIPISDPICMYEDGFLTISFEIPIGDAVLSIIPMSEDVDVLEQAMFSTDTPYTIYIGELSDPVEIVITTNNAEYTAVLQ